MASTLSRKETVIAPGPREHLWNGLVLREFLGHFYETYRQVRSMADEYQDGRGVHFPPLDRLVRHHVFPLKEVTHRLFRLAEGIAAEQARDASDAVGTGTVLDLTLGVLFHEVLELKEQAYLLTNYRPRLAGITPSGDLVARELEALRRLVQDAAQHLPRTVDAVRELMRSSLDLLHRLLPAWREERMVVLFFATHGELLDAVYGGKGIETVFRHMFGDDCAAGWYATGRFLWEIGHAPQALDAFEACMVRDRGRRSDAARARRRHMSEILRAVADGKAWTGNKGVAPRAKNLLVSLRKIEEETQ